MWKKIVAFFAIIGAFVLAFIGYGSKRKEYDNRIIDNEREIRKSIDNQRKSIDRGIEIIGDNEKRERETSELVQQSRDLRKRVADLIGK